MTKNNDIKVGDKVGFYCPDLGNGDYAKGEVLAIKKGWFFSEYLVSTQLKGSDEVLREYRYSVDKSGLFGL